MHVADRAAWDGGLWNVLGLGGNAPPAAGIQNVAAPYTGIGKTVLRVGIKIKETCVGIRLVCD